MSDLEAKVNEEKAIERAFRRDFDGHEYFDEMELLFRGAKIGQEDGGGDGTGATQGKEHRRSVYTYHRSSRPNTRPKTGGTLQRGASRRLMHVSSARGSLTDASQSKLPGHTVLFSSGPAASTDAESSAASKKDKIVSRSGASAMKKASKASTAIVHLEDPKSLTLGDVNASGPQATKTRPEEQLPLIPRQEWMDQSVFTALTDMRRARIEKEEEIKQCQFRIGLYNGAYTRTLGQELKLRKQAEAISWTMRELGKDALQKHFDITLAFNLIQKQVKWG
ncbi:hypothetical protein CBR_g944 [Chara braunii]|uniref:Uncharacterized protein n=1 Tax=Chara braunii TaxID=69332 RepID=A0A388KCZ9_CHABU|nr:hypothetical protein CBR_g944 [Chara braunii]|eukprot:GBG67823.1 hypothetical protein CBR_g944 [Chara braunii]